MMSDIQSHRLQRMDASKRNPEGKPFWRAVSNLYIYTDHSVASDPF